ncbi:MAG TPA: hypothetical protein VH143_15200 [Kofleriaceae bacterium]|nr:hypothetical protein [Kofleriaceae bacterium]
MRFALLLVAACSQAPTLTIGVATNPLAFAFRPDGGEWQQATLLSISEKSQIFEVPAQDGTIAVACTRPDGTFQVEELLATAADLETELYGALLPWPQLDCALRSTVPRVEVSGSMVQAGTVYIGDRKVNGDGEWQFNTAVTGGAHDVVAFDLNGTVFIDRGVAVDAPTRLPTIDTSNGIDTTEVELDPTVAFSVVETILTTANGTRVDLNETALFIPSEALDPGDSQILHVVALTPSGVIAQAYALATDETQGLALQFLDLPTGATFGTDDVSVDFSDVEFTRLPTEIRLQYSTDAGTLAVTATSAWLYEHGRATTFAFDETFPGFSWPIEPSASQHELLVQQRSDVIELQTALLDPP